VFISPLVLKKQQSTTLTGIFILTVRVDGMPLTSRSRFGFGPEHSQEGTSPETGKQELHVPLLLVPLKELAGRQAPTAWLVCCSAQVRLDAIGLLWANLGGVRYSFVFTVQHFKVDSASPLRKPDKGQFWNIRTDHCKLTLLFPHAPENLPSVMYKATARFQSCNSYKCY